MKASSHLSAEGMDFIEEEHINRLLPDKADQVFSKIFKPINEWIFFFFVPGFLMFILKHCSCTVVFIFLFSIVNI